MTRRPEGAGPTRTSPSGLQDDHGRPLLHFLPRRPEGISWLSLGRLPTPVEPVELPGAGPPFWIKRDDLSGPSAGLPGGNKVRKLELILADVLSRGASSVVTNGTRASTHLLCTARYAAWCGLSSICVAAPQPEESAFTRERFAALKATPRTRVVSVPSLALGPPIALALAALPGVAYVEPGGSGPRGVIGHVAAACELALQIRAGLLPAPAAIYVAAGSGGTLAGLLLGLRLAGLHEVRVVGVQVVPRPILTATLVALQCAAAYSLLAGAVGGNLPASMVRPADVRLQTDQLGPGYARSTASARQAVSAAQAVLGLRLETTYTGKALAALLQANHSRQPSDPPLLLWNTFDGRTLEPFPNKATRCVPSSHKQGPGT